MSERKPPEITTDNDKWWLFKVKFDDGQEICDSICADTKEQAEAWVTWHWNRMMESFAGPDKIEGKVQGFEVEILEHETEFLDGIDSALEVLFTDFEDEEQAPVLKTPRVFAVFCIETPDGEDGFQTYVEADSKEEALEEVKDGMRKDDPNFDFTGYTFVVPDLSAEEQEMADFIYQTNMQFMEGEQE